MAHDWPDLPELLRTVREFIDGVALKLQGVDRFHALCAIYLVEIAERELSEWEPRETVDDARLRRLARAAPAVARSELAALLCQRIRAGEFEQDMDQLLAELTAHVVAKVRVSKPSCLEQEHRQP